MMERVQARRLAVIAILCALVTCPSGVAAQGRQGEIVSLVANDAPNLGDAICVTAVLHAISKVQESNLSLQIIAPDGSTVVVTETTAVPDRLPAGSDWTYKWCLFNTAFPSSGTYSVHACWSTGRARNCNIAGATTTFYSVPTLGAVFLPLLIATVALVLWRHGRPSTRAQGAAQ
jgi:hypothetical protein